MDVRDTYYTKAKAQGFRARSAYKLIEILDMLNIHTVEYALDLCAAPGSWSQVLSQRMSSKSKIISVDINDIEDIPGVCIIKGDITSESVISMIKERFDKKIDLILCDGAPELSGLHDLDDYFQSFLIKASCFIAKDILKSGGYFICKIFMSKSLFLLIDELKPYFKSVVVVKPYSSRIKSEEGFIICTEALQDRIRTVEKA